MGLQAISLETPFTADLVAAPATVSGGATATVDTDGSGLVTGYTVIDGGSGYTQGQNVTVTEDGGPGSATAAVTL